MSRNGATWEGKTKLNTKRGSKQANKIGSYFTSSSKNKSNRLKVQFVIGGAIYSD